ncbi:MAG: hypothetical protein BGO21_15105 [Dyadobacter sp. 50-39]|nr:MAG: hypothetical protein BGO21_15105 [Dyadobacter sp. 50-39]
MVDKGNVLLKFEINTVPVRRSLENFLLIFILAGIISINVITRLVNMTRYWLRFLEGLAAEKIAIR